jgi:hypothetical protein
MLKLLQVFDVLNLNNKQQTAISNSNLFRTFELTNLNNDTTIYYAKCCTVSYNGYGKI